jgi:hypothetical protein
MSSPIPARNPGLTRPMPKLPPSSPVTSSPTVPPVAVKPTFPPRIKLPVPANGAPKSSQPTSSPATIPVKVSNSPRGLPPPDPFPKDRPFSASPPSHIPPPLPPPRERTMSSEGINVPPSLISSPSSSTTPPTPTTITTKPSPSSSQNEKLEQQGSNNITSSSSVRSSNNGNTGTENTDSDLFLVMESPSHGITEATYKFSPNITVGQVLQAFLDKHPVAQKQKEQFGLKYVKRDLTLRKRSSLEFKHYRKAEDEKAIYLAKHLKLKDCKLENNVSLLC